MATDPKVAAVRELSLSTFMRLKDLVRQLEEDERRVTPGSSVGQIEFKLSADDMAWYVAYKTSAESLEIPTVDLSRG
jgi:hypothetical protein